MSLVIQARTFESERDTINNYARMSSVKQEYGPLVILIIPSLLLDLKLNDIGRAGNSLL